MACPLTVVPVVPGFDPATLLDIAATDHALWLLRNGYFVARIELDASHDDALSSQAISVDSAGTVRRLVSPLQPVREPTDSAPDNVVFGQRTEETTSTFGTTICAGLGTPLCNDNESIANVTQIEPATGGMVFERAEPAVSYFHLPGAGAGTVATLDDLASGSREVPLAANSKRAFWFRANSSAEVTPSISSKIYVDTQSTVPITIDAVPVTLAANEERVFAAPCAGSPACSYSTENSSAADRTALLRADMVGGPSFQHLHVDGSRLIASTDGATYLCDLHDCSALPAPWQGASVRAFTRNSHSLFVLVGGNLFRARRTPLKAASPL